MGSNQDHVGQQKGCQDGLKERCLEQKARRNGLKQKECQEGLKQEVHL